MHTHGYTSTTRCTPPPPHQIGMKTAVFHHFWETIEEGGGDYTVYRETLRIISGKQDKRSPHKHINKLRRFRSKSPS